MIPVHGSTQDTISDLALLVVNELEAVERGIKVLARAVPLDEGVVIDAFALDVDRKPVLVLVEGGGDDLHARAADALLAYRRSRVLLARLLSSESFDETIDPRLMLVARRFSDRIEARCRLLPGADTTLVEVAIVDGGAGQQVLLLARGNERALKRAPSLRLLTRAESRAATSRREASHAGAAEVVAESPPAGAPPIPDAADAADAPADWLDEMKARILRISPDILEEQDGEQSRFRFGSNLLVSLCRDGEGVTVRFEDANESLGVSDRDGCAVALDNVFERFFNLVATRRRSGAKDGSLARTAAARMDV
jgi:hypothetical protein